MTELKPLERARQSSWPETLTSGNDIRKRADRRQRQQWVTGAAGACAIIAAVTFGSGALFDSDDQGQIATEPPDSERTIALSDVSFTIPQDWEKLRTPGPGQSCVGPATSAAGECPVLVAVAPEPDTAPEAGLDVVSNLMRVCDVNDPRIVEVVNHKGGPPATSTYAGRCTDAGETMTAWALDNRAAYVLTRDSRWATDAANIFASLQGPLGPEPTSVPPSAEPEPGESQ